jgi:hypothetical protein
MTVAVWETIFFQTLAKMASGLKLLLAKMKKSSPCLASEFFFKLALSTEEQQSYIYLLKNK